VDQLRDFMSFNQEFFFLVILPPILFESGYNLHRVSTQFKRNFKVSFVDLLSEGSVLP
jgi:NhaP-type Na+/H+ or K+/H+ antiporter